ncbi:UDP-N-acetylmuramoyl-tripeptide--D-alanyl-D-alanine ligase [Desulfoplanes formicivorans]|uniref:UDP-N-acetylmuramoyl-tripeptide--D-alanyl-D-alanine ligase n=1 Tax=Desulfoplanes formicivorans TaxID=1592317 RepID=A0A194AER2_9BACT|nr:UDP-N-acetylmuramoyl-tripeptide--D-alanyl-D-alanine ligase [Desulfoplanes formicivorans]GAU07818.1 UDP-N-acetylmuramoylalanyl-D-glutamyl-2, 6-diaminopimelate--D-alanyl-D-alanine ligase [Desulfoplanes formicivorans]
MRLGLWEIATAMDAMGDVTENNNRDVLGVQTDSRLVRRGDLFVCIVGKNMDGHCFAAEAARKGACAIVAHSPLPEIDSGVPVLLVRNTLEALGRLALYWRTRTGATVIGITGSAGKTTVREMLASLLAMRGKTARNSKNWNNQLGLPLSMLACSGDEMFWVMELGISRPGDMEELGAILRPDHVLITNVGPCHLEGLEDVVGVAKAKATLMEYMSAAGTAVVSKDYPELVEQVGQYAAHSVLFSTQDALSPFSAVYEGMDDQGMGRFRLTLNGQARTLSLPMHGQEMAENCIAVATMARCLGMDSETILQGLATHVPVAQRFRVTTRGLWTVIDDTYNANPLSMRCSIERAGLLHPDDPLVLVLGEMKELGDYAGKGHVDLGTWVGQSSASLLFFAGEHADDVRQGLGAWDGRFVPVASPDELRDHVRLLPSRGTILFKGSRSCRMEKYLEVFLGEQG